MNIEQTPLIFGIIGNKPLEEIKKAILAGDDINEIVETDQGLSTPLMEAITKNRLDIVKLLVEKGANVNKIPINDVEDSPLVLAISLNFDNKDIPKYLVEHGADINMSCGKEDYETIPLNEAIETENIEMVKFLISKGANVNNPLGVDYPIEVAIDKESPEILKLLIDNNANVNVMGRYTTGWVPMLCLVTETKKTDMAKILVDNGVDVLAKDENGRNFLHHAILSKNLAMVKYAHSLGFDVNEKDLSGHTPLTMALNGDIKIFEFLLKQGADPNIQNAYGRTAILIALSTRGKFRAVKMLLEYGADPFIIDNTGECAGEKIKTLRISDFMKIEHRDFLRAKFEKIGQKQKEEKLYQSATMIDNVFSV